jgi:hypothetical protein
MINAASRSDSAHGREFRVAPRKLKPRLGEFAQHEGKLLLLYRHVEAMLRTLALQLIPQLIDRIVSRADAALTTESKGESVTRVLQDHRHCRNPFAFVFLMTGLRDAGRLTRAVIASMSRLTASR